MDELLLQGAASYKAGDLDTARRLFQEAVEKLPDNEQAWQALYNVSKTDPERIHCLEQIMRINPDNEKAHSFLLKLKNQNQDSLLDQPSESIPNLPAEEPQPVSSPPNETDLNNIEVNTMVGSATNLIPAQAEGGNINDRAIIGLLQRQNEILQGIQIMLHHSTEVKSEKIYQFRTRIVDVDISINSLANLMFKWIVASIPVGIVIGFIVFIVTSCLAVGIGR